MRERYSTNQYERDPNETYANLLGNYQDVVCEIKGLKLRHGGVENDPELLNAVRTFDEERHRIHLELKRIGASLGKSENDIIADIRLLEKSLEEYGLPEFVLMDSESFYNLQEPPFADDKLAIVYETGTQYWSDPIFTNDLWTESKDKPVRRKRGEALAKKLGGEFITIVDGNTFHDTDAYYASVVMPKERLMDAVNMIRKYPDKYRIGDEFYSDKDREEIKKYLQNEITNIQRRLEATKENNEHIKKTYGVENQDGGEIDDNNESERYNDDNDPDRYLRSGLEHQKMLEMHLEDLQKLATE
ncbi:MAG: hypothetical protein Q8Q39_03115 [bacterium]|nr:hypothetical protein [bacterium]